MLHNTKKWFWAITKMCLDILCLWHLSIVYVCIVSLTRILCVILCTRGARKDLFTPQLSTAPGSSCSWITANLDQWRDANPAGKKSISIMNGEPAGIGSEWQHSDLVTWGPHESLLLEFKGISQWKIFGSPSIWDDVGWCRVRSDSASPGLGCYRA